MYYKIIWESDYARVVQVYPHEYAVYTLSSRNYDGIIEVDWNFSCHFTNHYRRDWLGRVVCIYSTDVNYAYKSAMEYAMEYTKRCGGAV